MSSAASGLQQQGQKLYQKGDFKAAIQAFSEVLVRTRPKPEMAANDQTQALNQKGADTVSLLDNRAATYCKHEQYDQARRDARSMIKQGKEDDRVSDAACRALDTAERYIGVSALCQSPSSRGKARQSSGGLCIWLEGASEQSSTTADGGAIAQEAPGPDGAKTKRPLHNAAF